MHMTPLRRLLVPVFLVFLALVLRSRILEADQVYHRLLQQLPYLTLSLAALLALFFNRARLLAAALLVLLAAAALPLQAPGLLATPRPAATYALVSVILPLAVFSLMYLTERGVRSSQGLRVLALVPGLGLAGAWLVSGADASSLSWLQQHMPVYPWEGMVLSLRATLLMATVIIAGILLLVWRGTEDVAALVGVLLIAFVALSLFDRRGMASVLFAAAGASLVVSLLRSSHEMAFRDELTGILGRRALNDRLKELGRRYTIAMLDVDHFKRFNDTHGHEIGDDVLRMVARHIDGVGGGGTAYRYGGEEFSVVFPGKSLDQCTGHLEAVRRAIARYRLVVRDSKHRNVPGREAKMRRGRSKASRDQESVSVTISIGAAERSETLRDPEAVIKAADLALYRAKEKGRNCLVT